MPLDYYIHMDQIVIHCNEFVKYYFCTVLRHYDNPGKLYPYPPAIFF
jgi:hypothetical protein